MCEWEGTTIRRRDNKRIDIEAGTIQDACHIIHSVAEEGRAIDYTSIMNLLKENGHRKINRGTIGSIIGKVSAQIAQVTNPSIYPSAIVVRKGTMQIGSEFWGLQEGTHPPINVPGSLRNQKLKEYQHDVFQLDWHCNC